MFVYIILENISPPNPDDVIDETEEPNNDLNLDIPRTNNGCFFSTVCKRTGKQKGITSNSKEVRTGSKDIKIDTTTRIFFYTPCLHSNFSPWR